MYFNDLVPKKFRVSPGSSHGGELSISTFNDATFQLGPSLDLLSGIVSSYNVRNLTFPGDRQQAFAGVESVLSKRNFPGGLFWGLPVGYFHMGLAWRCEDNFQVRRHEVFGLPSWSWMGWEGSISWEGSSGHEEEALVLWKGYRLERAEYVPLGDCSSLVPLPALIAAENVEVCSFFVVDQDFFDLTLLGNDTSYSKDGARGRLFAPYADIKAGSLLDCIAIAAHISAGGKSLTYRVLWIKTQGDISYRCGMGIVDIGLWAQCTRRRRRRIILG